LKFFSHIGTQLYKQVINNPANPTSDIKDLVANSASWGATLAKDIQNRLVPFAT
jgi:hypothetical protein